MQPGTYHAVSPVDSSYRVRAPFGACWNFTGEIAHQQYFFPGRFLALQNRIGGLEKKLFNRRALRQAKN
jgi:hypothetical protein